mmetsp:Transcript_22323/g.31046  ORF Transcript_22323/g.31046 Transcript_22323/m.31046 type:complete len:287 (-) Transcript_22323:188-1048(-)
MAADKTVDGLIHRKSQLLFKRDARLAEDVVREARLVEEQLLKAREEEIKKVQKDFPTLTLEKQLKMAERMAKKRVLYIGEPIAVINPATPTTLAATLATLGVPTEAKQVEVTAVKKPLTREEMRRRQKDAVEEVKRQLKQERAMHARTRAMEDKELKLERERLLAAGIKVLGEKPTHLRFAKDPSHPPSPSKSPKPASLPSPLETDPQPLRTNQINKLRGKSERSSGSYSSSGPVVHIPSNENGSKNIKTQEAHDENGGGKSVQNIRSMRSLFFWFISNSYYRITY